MRSSDAFLCQEILLCGITATPPHREITKTAIGAENSVNWKYCERTIDAVNELKKNGFAVFAKAYSPSELEAYLEPIIPQWDAAHILRLWFRYRDQHVFWPWNKQFDANRSDTDVPDLDFLHRGVVELLQAGDGPQQI